MEQFQQERMRDLPQTRRLETYVQELAPNPTIWKSENRPPTFYVSTLTTKPFIVPDSINI